MTTPNLKAISLPKATTRNWHYNSQKPLPWYTFILARHGLISIPLNNSIEDFNGDTFVFSHGYWPLDSTYSPENAPFANIMTLALYPFQGVPAICLDLLLPDFVHYQIKGKMAALDYQPAEAKLCWLLVVFLHDSQRHAAFYISAKELEKQCLSSTKPFTFECNLGVNDTNEATSLLFDATTKNNYEFCLWQDLKHRPFQAHSLALVLADTKLTPVLADEVSKISYDEMVIGNRWTPKKDSMPKGCLAFYDMSIRFSSHFKIVSD